LGARVMTDDGFNVGVLYAGSRTPYPLGPRTASTAVAALDDGFAA